MNIKRIIKLFVLLCLGSVLVSYFNLLSTSDSTDTPVITVNDNLIKKVLEEVGKDSRYGEIYRSKDKLPKDTKYILLWTDRRFAPLNMLMQGQKAFVTSNCSVINCYVTADREFFGGDMTKFDAIFFNGRTMEADDLPKQRSPHQIYIYTNMESSDNMPVCNSVFDGFFNRTATYRLDSDLQFVYIHVEDKEGHVVGPKKDMHWEDISGDILPEYPYLFNKTKAAAWFVSNCKSLSKRQEFEEKLQKALSSKYNLDIDVYGLCGKHTCPKTESDSCYDKLKREYFFYLSFENSLSEDYVTEKLLTALDNYAVPIVYGGANYSRFLPPGSYIDASQLSQSEQGISVLASMVAQLIKYPKNYLKYFRWRNYYRYIKPYDIHACSVCAALNNETFVKNVKVYDNFRHWWNPNYKSRCKV